MKRYALPLTMALTSLVHICYGQLEIGATVRPRTEYRHGFKRLMRPGEEAAFFTEQRSRINLNYKAEKFYLGLVFQDVRIWGETGQINKTDALTSFHEAYFEYFITKKFSVKAGRQELDYDDARILGNLDWAAQGRSHDALLLKYTDSTWAAHVGVAYNQNGTPPEPSKLTENFYTSPAFGVLGGGLPNPKTMQFLWFGKSFSRFRFSLLALNTGWQIAADSSVNNIFTEGFNPDLKISNKFGLDASGYIQAGKDRNGKKTSAWMASLNLKYNIHKSVCLTLGGDYLSGTRRGATKSTAFEPLFGTNHKFYGYMDYFYVGNPHAQEGRTVGLIDIYLKGKIKTSGKSNLGVDLHHFLSPVTVYEAPLSPKGASSSLGTEVDAVFNFVLAPSSTLTAGYSQMFATHTMEIIKGGDAGRINNWAWLMLTFKPVVARM